MKSKIGQTGTSLRAGFRSLDAIAEKYCLFHFVVQGPWSFSGWSTFLYDVRLRSYGASKLPNVPSGDQPTAHGLHRRMIPIFPCDSQRSKGVPSGLLIGELGTPKLAQIFAYGKWLYPYRMLLIHGASDLDQRCLKTLICKDGCTFPPNIFAPTPKVPPNPILETFNCKTYYRESSP